MELNIEHPGSYFEITVSGPADRRKFEELVDSLLAHESWKPDTPILVVETDLDATEISFDDVGVIAEICTRRKSEVGKSRIALFVARDVEFGMNRMWTLFVEDKWDAITNVFRSRGEAIDWLLCPVSSCS